MPHKNETRADEARASRNSCGCYFRESPSPNTIQSQPPNTLTRDLSEEVLPNKLANDEIYVFLGSIPLEEYQRRAKLRTYRNAACAMLSGTPSDTVRNLAWEAIEWISPNIYSPAPIEWLDKVTQLVSRLLKTAMTADELHRMQRGGG